MDAEMMKQIQEYIDNQDEVRTRFVDVYMRGKPILSIARTAAELKMSPNTINGFINGYKRVELSVLWRIDCWTQEREKERREERANPKRVKRSYTKPMDRI